MTRANHEGVRTRLWRDGRLEVEDFALEEISNHLQEEGALVWVDLCEPPSTFVITALAATLYITFRHRGWL